MPRMLSLLILSFSLVGSAQVASESGVPAATQWVLDAAGPTQRVAINSVLLMYCAQSQKKGTAFYVREPEVVITNEHVVHGCSAAQLVGYLPTGKDIHFRTMDVDVYRDLAVLRSTTKLTGGLELGSDATLKIGTTVSTWGFPLIYNGPAPQLSVGYVAGFNAAKVGDRTVKPIVVNGAFNPGNSGGPVFVSQDNRVVGVVVWRQRILSPLVPTVIEGYKRPGPIGMMGRFSRTAADGKVTPISDEEAIGLALEEFYNTVQVMIGETKSVSELKTFLATLPQEASTK